MGSGSYHSAQACVFRCCFNYADTLANSKFVCHDLSFPQKAERYCIPESVPESLPHLAFVAVMSYTANLWNLIVFHINPPVRNLPIYRETICTKSVLDPSYIQLRPISL
jgi:hypothetical protein